MDFSRRYKKRTIQFQSSENSRAVRAVKHAEARKTKRGDALFQRRQMDLSSTEDSFIDTHQRCDKENKEIAAIFQNKKTIEELAEERYQKLLKWRDERRKVMEVEKRTKKPAFKTGLYQPDLPKYLVSDAETVPADSRLDMTRTPGKFSFSSRPTKVWHNVSANAGTPSQAQMKPLLRFRTGLTPSVGSAKPQVLRALDTSQNEPRALRVSSRLASKFSKDTPARKTDYKKRKISNVSMTREPVRDRNRHKKIDKFIDTKSFMSFAPENFIFEAPKGIDAKVMQPTSENQEEVFYPAKDFCLDEEKAPQVNLPKMARQFFSSRNHGDQYDDESDQGIVTEESSDCDGQLHYRQDKKNAFEDSNAKEEPEEKQDEVPVETEAVQCIDSERKIEGACLKESEEVKDSGVEDTEGTPFSEADTDDSSPKDNLHQSSDKKVSIEVFETPVASKPSSKNVTPKSSPSLRRSLSLEKSCDIDEGLNSLFLKIPSCHHEPEGILVSPVRPRTRRSFAISQQVLTPHQPIRVQTPCSRKTRRSLVAHSDLSPASLLYTPDTKPGRRRSMRRAVVTPQENSGSSTNSDDTKENSPHEQPTPCARRKSKGRRSSRRSFLRDLPMENQPILFEADEPVDGRKMSIVAEKEQCEVDSNQNSLEDQLRTPEVDQRKEKMPWMIRDSPFITMTRGSSSKKKQKSEFVNEMKELFHDIPTDGSPLPAYLTPPLLNQPSPTQEMKQDLGKEKSPVHDSTCTNILALLEDSSPSKEDITDSVASVWDEFTPAKVVAHGVNSMGLLSSANKTETSNFATPDRKGKCCKKRPSVSFNVDESERNASFKFPVTPVHFSTKKITKEVETLYEDSSLSPVQSYGNNSQLESANGKKTKVTTKRSRISLLPGLPNTLPTITNEGDHDEPPTMKFFSLDTPMRDSSSSASPAVTPRRSRRLSKAVL